MPYVVYALLAGLADPLAGWFALRAKAERIQPRYVIGFAAGVLLGVTFFHILPETNLATDYPYLALGFLTFYLLEKVMMIHACGESECETHRISPVAVLGMALDNVVDGVGIAVGYLIEPLLGLTIAAAVVLHEIPQGTTSALIMKGANWSRPQMFFALTLAGALYPLGALAAGFVPEQFRQLMLAFIAGDFIYIGAGDLLPEAHRRFNWKVILAVLLGMAFALTLKVLIPLA